MMAGVLLAAGGSTRMGRPKALVRSQGESFIAHGIVHLWAACDVVVVVLGSNAATVRKKTEEEFVKLIGSPQFARDLKKSKRKADDEMEVHFVVNARWKRGMLSSAVEGLRAVAELKPEAVLVLPVDHPNVKPETVLDLAVVMQQALAASRSSKVKQTFSYALIPRHGRRRGHPVVLSPALAQAVTRDTEAVDLSDAIRRNARLVGYLDVKDAGVTRNRNRPGD